MSKVICIMGESGAGKTTSMRNLDPNTTLYIDTDKKGLSWKGWKEQYSVEKKNYAKTDNPESVVGLLHKVNQLTNIKTVVVDTINGIMVADEMRRVKDKGYDKWQDLAQAVYFLIDNALTLRDDLTVILIAHSQTERDDFGNAFTRIKTNGKKLEKIVLESKMTTVLYAVCKDGNYVFQTKLNNSTVKAPLGAFEVDEIENDVTKILVALEEY